METTTNSHEPVGDRRLPGFVVDTLLPTVHRRAAEAALLRDRRLELAVDPEGNARARMVAGVSAPNSPVRAVVA
jgi:hypothetical protein